MDYLARLRSFQHLTVANVDRDVMYRVRVGGVVGPVDEITRTQVSQIDVVSN
jgi:hypothetical protein